MTLETASVDDSADRARRRQKRVLQGGAASAVSRLIGVACGFITLPIVLNSLGKQDFGVFLTLSSLTTLLVVLNLGVGDGLVTLIARASAHDDHARMQRLISSTLFALVFFVSLLVVAVVLASPAVVWSRFIGVSDEVTGASTSVLVSLIVALVNIPLSVSIAIRRGLQESWVASLVYGFLGIFQVVGVSIAAAADASLPWFVFAFVVAAPVTNVLNGVLLLLHNDRSWLRPRRDHIDRHVVREVLSAGGLYAVLGLVVSVAYGTDALILANVLGPEAVAEWGVASRVFMLVPTVVGFFLIPLWPAYSEAWARGDLKWISRTFQRSVLLGAAVGVVGGLLLALLTRPLIRMFVGGEVVPGDHLVLAFTGFVIVLSVSTPLAMYMNGAHIMRFQIVTSLLMAAVNVPLSIYLTRKVGISGPVWGTVISQTVCTLIPCAVYLPGHLRRAGAVEAHPQR